jgi:hypothetical protein
MNKLPRIIILFALLIFTLSSCSKKSRSLFSGGGKEEFELLDTNFEYLTTRTKLKFKDPTQNMSANSTIRMKKDSAIWIIVTPVLGIEAGRCLITRESVLIVDRINRTYSEFDYFVLSRMFAMPINFDILQEVFLGNMPFPIQAKDKISRKGNSWEVKQSSQGLTVENILNAGIMKLEKLHATQSFSNNQLQMNFQDYQKIDDIVIPFKSTLSLNYRNDGKKQQTEVQIEHSRVEISQVPLSFPISIPDRYTRK